MRYSDHMYKPLSEMAPYMKKEGQAYPIKIYLCVTDIIDGGEDSDKAVDLMLRLLGNNKFYVSNNGSFHEYNIALWSLPANGYFYNKYSARDNDYEARDKYYQPLDDGYKSDHSIIFVPDALYNIYMKYDVPWQLENNYEHYTPDKLDKHNGLQLITASEFPDILESETVRAVKCWKMSKDNYDEDRKMAHFERRLQEAEAPVIEDVREEEEDEERGMSRMSEVLLLHGKTRYNSPEVRPKNWNGTAWV